MAFTSYNCTLTYNSALLGEVTSLSISGLSRSEIDVTKLTDANKAFLVGATDPGSIECGVNFVGQAALLDVLDGPTGTPVAFSLLFAAVGTFAGSGYVTASAVEASVDGAITGTITIRCTGALTYTAA